MKCCSTVCSLVAGLALTAAAVGYAVPLAWAQQPDVKALQDKTKKAVDDAQKKIDDAKKAAMPGEMDDAMMMKKMMEAGTPGKEHAILADFVGTWNATFTGMMPGEGKMVNTMILGGRFLKQDWTGKAVMSPDQKEPMEFQGLGYWGYDNAQKKWVSTWMDSMSTGVMVSTGDWNAATKSWTSETHCTNPVTGQMEKGRTVLTLVSKDSHTFEMFGPGKDGKEESQMKITYTRAKDAMPAGKPAAPAAPATKPTGK